MKVIMLKGGSNNTEILEKVYVVLKKKYQMNPKVTAFERQYGSKRMLIYSHRRVWVCTQALNSRKIIETMNNFASIADVFVISGGNYKDSLEAVRSYRDHVIVNNNAKQDEQDKLVDEIITLVNVMTFSA